MAENTFEIDFRRGGVFTDKDGNLSKQAQQFIDALKRLMTKKLDSDSIVTGTAGNLIKIKTGGGVADAGVASSTDGTFTANSDAKLPTEKATKTWVGTRVTAWQTPTTNTNYPSEKLTKDSLDAKGSIVTAWQAIPDNTHYPSEKLVDDRFKGLWFNVKDYGAKGDGTTNDTSAVNLAIAAANALFTATGWSGVIFFPVGRYLITPSGMSEIRHSVFGVGAIAIGSSTAGGYIFNLNIGPDPPPSAVGSQQVKMFVFGTILGHAGSSITTHANWGVYVKQFESTIVQIGIIAGCSRGFWIDGYGNNTHNGNNNIHINDIQQCDYGIALTGGTSAGTQCENNIITGQYWMYCPNYIVYMGGNSGGVVDNVISVGSMTTGAGNNTANHFYAADNTVMRNRFYVMSFDSGASGTSKYVNVSLGGGFNIFTLPNNLDFADAYTNSRFEYTSTDLVQKWPDAVRAAEDVTASRGRNTVYRNTTGKTLHVSARMASDTTTDYASLLVGATSTPAIEQSYYYQEVINVSHTLHGVVPPGWYYEVSATGNMVSNAWAESH